MRSRYPEVPNLLDDIKRLSDRVEALERGNPLDNATFTVAGDISNPSSMRTMSISELGAAVERKVDSYEAATVSPDLSPTPTADGNVKSIVVSWAPITDASDVVVELHMSSDPNLQAVAGDTRTLLAEVKGTIYTVRYDVDGSELVFTDGDPKDPNAIPHVYYFQTIAKTAAGPAPHSNTGSGTLRLIDSPDISATAAWFGTVSVDQLTGGTLYADTVIGGEGGVVARGSAGEEVGIRGTGFTVKGPTVDGNPVYVDFPTAGGKPYLISQALQVTTLEVESDPISGRGLSMHGESEIAAAASLRIASAPQPPISAPQVVQEYETLIMEQPDDISVPATSRLQGGYYHDATNTYYNAYYKYIIKHNDLGQYLGAIDVGDLVPGEARGVAIIASSMYILSTNEIYDSWYVTKTDLAGTVIEANPKLIVDLPSSARLAQIAQYDNTPWVAFYDGQASTSRLKFRSLDPNTLETISTITSSTPYGTGSIYGFEVGAFDFSAGSPLFAVALSTNVCRLYDSTGTRIATFDFDAYPYHSFAWGANRFRSITYDANNNWIQYIYSSDKWTTESAVWWFATSRSDPSGPYETGLSPKVSITRTKRKGYRLTASFEGAEATNIYVARNATMPADSAMGYTNTVYVGESTFFSNGPTSFSGAPNTPIPFPNSTPGEIVSTDGGSYWKGDNTVKFLQAILDSPVDVTALTGNKPALRIGNPASLHLRVDNNQMQAMLDDDSVGSLLLNTEADAAGGIGAVQIGNGSTLIKRIKFGINTTVTLNGSGIGTIAHGLGGTPAGVAVGSQGNANFRLFTVTGVDATNITVRVENENGTVVTSTADAWWIALRS